jgi:hypothetical protein
LFSHWTSWAWSCDSLSVPGAGYVFMSMTIDPATAPGLTPYCPRALMYGPDTRSQTNWFIEFTAAGVVAK